MLSDAPTGSHILASRQVLFDISIFTACADRAEGVSQRDRQQTGALLAATAGNLGSESFCSGMARMLTHDDNVETMTPVKLGSYIGLK